MVQRAQGRCKCCFCASRRHCCCELPACCKHAGQQKGSKVFYGIAHSSVQQLRQLLQCPGCGSKGCAAFGALCHKPAKGTQTGLQYFWAAVAAARAQAHCQQVQTARSNNCVAHSRLLASGQTREGTSCSFLHSLVYMAA